jgi:cell division protein FtsI/penicillin-binding protein 2
MGLGEKAGWNIAGEEPGTLPAEQPKEGMGMMTSFGSGIYLTPLQLAALVSVFANGGTLYYLQYPKSQEEIASFQPKVKRQLDVARYVPEIKPGMNDAVEFGTARRANYDPTQPIFGKTGTCSDTRTPTHLGWFGSFNEVGDRKLVVAVLLTGGRPINGPVASGIAGQVYKILGEQNYFGPQQTAWNGAPLLATMGCCQ